MSPSAGAGEDRGGVGPRSPSFSSPSLDNTGRVFMGELVGPHVLRRFLQPRPVYVRVGFCEFLPTLEELNICITLLDLLARFPPG